MKNKILLYIIIVMLLVGSLYAQGPSVQWKRAEGVELDLFLFHSTHALNLPTAETLQKGDFLFEIHHRFNTPVSSGVGEVWGLDGGVTMRIAVGYAVTNKFLITLGRSNREGNIDLSLKYKAFQIRHDVFPTLIGLNVAGVYNGKPVNEIASSSRKYQFFISMIANTLYKKKLGIGIVPGYLYNSHIYCKDIQYSLTLGAYIQYYIMDTWSLIIEVNPTLRGWRDKYDSFAFGVELETGGHFFKILVGNNTAINLSQYLAGAGNSFKSGDWHLGFNISRLL